MADPGDVHAAKAMRREFNKRMMDITQCDMRVMHGVGYVTGVLKPIKGGPQDLKAEIELIGKILRQQGVIKDLVIHATFRS